MMETISDLPDYARWGKRMRQKSIHFFPEVAR
jgi:hypothetical protein